jgi:predicted ATPase
LTTVKWYVRQIYNKLGVNNRRELRQVAHNVDLRRLETAPHGLPQLNLPPQPTSFVGREHELEDLTKLIADSPTLLVTIFGIGGIGKTRLAIECARQSLALFSDGVYFVPLQPLAESDQIVPAIAHAIGLQFAQDARPARQQLLDYLNDKQMLLTLDNCEHLPACAPLVADMLRNAQGIKILATSREKLNLSGETVYTLLGMQFPTWETPEDALKYDAVKLLVDSAKRVRPDFEVTADNLNFVARVCRLTEGMPLGILLAAGWLDTLSLERICDEIQKSADFLETELSDMPQRQRSVRVVFESAWERLSPDDQRVFMKLSVFRGGCTPQAAEAVTGASLRALQNLTKKALVLQTKSDRYDIHELLRQYGYKRLEASGELDDLLRRHSQYFANFMHQREDHLKGRRQLDATDEIEADLDNIHQAWRQALADQDIDRLDLCLFSLSTYMQFRSRQLEFIPLFADAEATLRPRYVNHVVFGRLLAHYSSTMIWLMRYSDAESMLHEALALANRRDDWQGMAFAMRALGLTLMGRDRQDEAGRILEDSICLLEQLGDDYGLAEALHLKGNLLFFNGNIEESLAVARKTLAIRRRLGGEISIAKSLHNVAVGGWFVSTAIDEVEALLQESLALCRRARFPAGIAGSLQSVSSHAFIRGDIEVARSGEEEALQISYKIGDPLMIGRSLLHFCDIDIATDQFASAEQKLEEILRISVTKDRESRLGYALRRIWIRLGLGDWAGAEHSMREIMDVLRTGQFPSWWIEETPLAMGFILAEREQLERGLELASLSLNHPRMSRVMANSPLVARHLDAIRAQLSPDAYAAAWERGKSLDLETTIKELIATYDDLGV